MICYLMGAGASYGYNEEIPPEDRPPLAKGILSDVKRMGLLDNDDFEPVFEQIKKIPCVQISSELNGEENELKYDFERIQKKLNHRLETEGPPEEMLRQTALSSSYYLVYEVLRRHSLNYQPKGCCYQEMLASLEDTSASFLSMNYDTLLESAMSKLDMDYDYMPEDIGNGDGTFPVLKLHGSINWFNTMNQVIERRPNMSFLDVAKVVHSNIYCGNPISVPPEGLKEMGYRKLVLNTGEIYEPVIIPPIGNEKDFDKLTIYPKLWQKAQKCIDSSSELVIIGCSLREEDTRLTDLLRKYLEEGTKVKIVSPDQESVAKRLDDIVPDWRLAGEYDTFVDYVSSLP